MITTVAHLATQSAGPVLVGGILAGWLAVGRRALGGRRPARARSTR